MAKRITSKQWDLFFETLEVTGLIKHSARVAGIGWSTVKDRKAKARREGDEEWLRRFEDAEAAGMSTLEYALRDAAVGSGVEVRETWVEEDGTRHQRVTRRDWRAAHQLLASKDPEHRTKAQVDVKAEANVKQTTAVLTPYQLAKLSDEELATFEKLIAKGSAE